MTQMIINDSMTLTLSSDLKIVITRTFAAPRRLVFEAWTTPEYIKRWWGISRVEMISCEVDLRAGGAWRYVNREANGSEFAFSGVYQEVVPYERLVYTEMYEPMTEHAYTSPSTK